MINLTKKVVVSGVLVIVATAYGLYRLGKQFGPKALKEGKDLLNKGKEHGITIRSKAHDVFKTMAAEALNRKNKIFRVKRKTPSKKVNVKSEAMKASWARRKAQNAKVVTA